MPNFSTARPELSKDSLAKVFKAIEAIREARMLTVSAFIKEVGWSTQTYYHFMRGEGVSQMSVWKVRVWLRKHQPSLPRQEAA